MLFRGEKFQIIKCDEVHFAENFFLTWVTYQGHGQSHVFASLKFLHKISQKFLANHKADSWENSNNMDRIWLEPPVSKLRYGTNCTALWYVRSDKFNFITLPSRNYCCGR